MKTKAFIYVTIPGSVVSAKRNWLLETLQKDLKRAGIESQFVDTVGGWGNLNQDWLEFKCDIETSWGWCEILPLSSLKDESYDNLWKDFYFDLFHHGNLLMMVYYVSDDGELIPHS